MKQISILIVGVAAAFASAPAFSEDFTAGKTPAQLFRSDCGECHRSPNGLAKNADVYSLASFLREHYTTKSETAGAMAAYVSSFASNGRNRGTGAAAPARDPSRSRSNANSTSLPGLFDEPPPPRHRRAVNAPAAEKKPAHDDGDAPRPPRQIGSDDSPKTNAQTRTDSQSEAQDPVSRLRTYLSSGMNSSEAGNGTPKARKRRKPADDAPAAAGSNLTGSDAPAAAPQTAPAAVAQPAEAPAAETAPREP